MSQTNYRDSIISMRQPQHLVSLEKLSLVAKVSPDFQFKNSRIFYKLVVKRNGQNKMTNHCTFEDFKKVDELISQKYQE